MKTTIELPDDLMREVKARASLRGQTIKTYFTEAIQDKISKDSQTEDRQPGWRKVFGKGPKDAVAEVQRIIDEEFSTINPETWK